MRTQISQRVEDIFAHAVAMEQSGRLKNTVFCIRENVFIFNSDRTVLLKFQLRKTEAAFEVPLSFRANDYDSRSFYEEGGRIVFEQTNDEFQRKKSCASPSDSPEEIADLFRSFPRPTANKIQLTRNILPLLDSDLSHLEISGRDGKLNIVQRNVYSGSVIEIERKSDQGMGVVQLDSITTDFGPVGIRTNDFAALFTFVDLIQFALPDDTEQMDFCYFRSMDPKMAMEGVVALCLYDELGAVLTSRKENNNGRKEQERGRRESGVDPTPPTTTQRSRRCR